MKETTAQDCPLCGSAAEYYFVDYEQRKYFKCPKCTFFQISKRAEVVLARSPQQWRDAYSAKATRTPDEHLLVIIVPQPSQEEGGQSAAVSGDFVPKSELSLKTWVSSNNSFKPRPLRGSAAW